MTFANKNVVINGIKRSIYGLSDSDPYFFGITDRFEEDFAHFCAKHIQANYKCWDIGSNIGITSLIMSDFCTDGEIVAVGGGGSATKIHSLNNNANSIKNVKFINAAVYDKDEEVGFKEYSAFGGIDAASQMVKGISPRTLYEMCGWAPDFVKIDCEGHEYPIIRAGVDLFKKHGTLIQFEFNSYAMVMQQSAQPMEFLKWFCAEFEHVYLRPAGSANLEFIDKSNLINVLHRNLTKQEYTFLDDFVVCSDIGKICL